MPPFLTLALARYHFHLSVSQPNLEDNLLIWEKEAVIFQLAWKKEVKKEKKNHTLQPRSASFNHPRSKYLHLTRH